MKKIFLVLLACASVTGVVKASSEDGTKSPLGIAVMKTGSTIKLFYKGEKPGTVKINILDSKGNLVFSETIRKVESFARPYNFSSMAEGDYTIEVNDESGKQSEKVGYYSGKVERFFNLKKLTGAGKYLLTISNKGEETLTVKIFNNANVLIYNHKEKILGDFARVYNLKDVSGEVLFEITDGNGTIKSLSY